MWEYLVTFIMSCFLVYIAEKMDKNKKIAYRILCIIAFLLPCILAGLRAPEVGTDVQFYMIKVFLGAKGRTFYEYLLKYGYNFELLYLLLNYIISRFTNNWHVLQFFIQLIMMTFLYMALKDNSDNDNMPIWMGLWIYYTLFFIYSLNIMRQMIALLILFYALKYVYTMQIKKYLLFVLIAMGFHRTAIVAILLYILYYALNKYNRKVVFGGTIIGLFITFFFYRDIAALFARVFTKYEYYIPKIYDNKFLFNPFAIRIPFIAFIAIYFGVYKRKDMRIYFWFILLLADLLFEELRFSNNVINRIAIYCGVIKIHAYPFIAEGFSFNQRKIIRNLICIATLIICIYQMLMGVGEVYPYKSDVLT